MKLSDLPPDLRRQAEAKLGAASKRTTRRQVPAGATPGRCGTCAEVFARYGVWERHSDATGHRRWKMDTATTADRSR